MTNHARFFFFLTMNPPLSIFPAAACAPINHLLAQEPWARDQLLAHAGKVACLDVGGGMAIRLKIGQDGLVKAAEADEQPNVTIRIKLADLPLIMQKRERAFSYVKLEGDADFANAISQVSQSLRWEAEEDLSKWVGDIAAVRIVSGTKAVVESIKATQQTLTENVAEYFLEENPMLMRPQPIADFAADVAKLRDGVERLAKRIEKLSAK
jgi:ubiquinone biosynthesis protein UbiJ